MGRQEIIPNKPPCPGCDGQGGYWKPPNGDAFKRSVWVVCELCKGKKHV